MADLTNYFNSLQNRKPVQPQAPVVPSPTAPASAPQPTVPTGPATPPIENKALAAVSDPQSPVRGVFDKPKTTSEMLSGAWDIVKNVPKAIAKAGTSLALTVGRPIKRLVTGDLDGDTMQKDPINLPWLGDVPDFYQMVQARIDKTGAEQGLKPGTPVGGATVFPAIYKSGGEMLLQILDVTSLADIAVNAFRPRGKIVPGEQIKNTEPIQKAILEDTQQAVSAPVNSPNSYYSMPKTDSKLFGANDVHWKVTPAGEGKLELSAVRMVDAKKIGSTVNTPLGSKVIERGDFGGEIKLKTEIIDVADGGIPPATMSAIDGPPLTLRDRPLKGTENLPITADDVLSVRKIGDSVGLQPELRDSIIRTITGKKNLGELTQAEFVQVSNTLASFGKKYVPDQNLGPFGWIRSVASPQRHYFDYVEERFGYPLKSQVYTPIEEGARIAGVLSDSLNKDYLTRWGKYSAGKYIEERRLIDSYIRGDQGAILNNTAISAAEKTSLVEAANNVKNFFDTVGPSVNVPFEIYKQNYLPRLAERGGAVQKYKDLGTVPGKSEFFAKQKRTPYGMIEPIIDDPLVSGQIYINQGAKALHMGPALDKAKALVETLPDNLKKSANSYIQEKLGYGGGAERFIDSFVPAVNSKMKGLGIELPADASRQMSNYMLSSMYSGLLSSPATWARQSLQLPTYVYGRMGPKFLGSAVAKSFTTAGKKEAADAGVLLDLAVPYGEELTKNLNPVGKAGLAFKEGTQAIIKPNSMVDNQIRTITFHQGKMIWDDAFSKYNGGKLTWKEFENAIDMKAFSGPDRQTIRQLLVEGKPEEAFKRYITETIDETSFPYRKGASARMTYGLTGKLSTGLMTYSIEAANVLTRWARSGQWEKLIRFAAGASVTNDTLKETLGMDFSRSFNLVSQFGNTLSPAVQTGINMAQYLQGISSNNQIIKDENAAEIHRNITSSLPAGVLAKNLLLYKKSYDEGPNKQGEYNIYDAKGKLKYTSNYADLFWGTLMGFPTQKKQDEADLYRKMSNDIQKTSEIRDRLDQLVRAGDFDQVDAIIEKTGVMPSSGAIRNQVIPRNTRLFQQLPGQLKVKYAGEVYK